MRRLDLVCCPETLDGLQDTFTCFTAGAIQGSSPWQHNLPVIPGLTWVSPRRYDYKDFDYDEQFKWETIGLKISDFILFWIPSPVENIQGRDYGQTTRTEFGEFYKRPGCVFGCYPDFPGRRYFEKKVEEQGKVLHTTLEECIEELKSKILSHSPKIFFTSDTHFGSQRALELSKRPFRDVNEMDWTMIERWNSIVNPNDVVYHLGDFGESWPAQYLNGKIRLILGNYERDGKTPIPPGVEVIDPGNYMSYYLSHEPPKIGHSLFGHIHGRQMVKPWVGLDVGVDCHNFTPVPKEDADFYLNAIYKGYYDSLVWE